MTLIDTMELMKKHYRKAHELAPEIEEAIVDVAALYSFSPLDNTYFKTKSDILEYMGINCIEQFEKGELAQAKNSRRILEAIIKDMIVKEQR